MPSKKKNTRKSRAQKQVSKKPPVKKTPASEAVAPIVEPVVAKKQPNWLPWIPLAVVVVLLIFSVVYTISRRSGQAAPEQSQSSDNSPSDLIVVPGQGGNAASPQSSGALQPQVKGLQQAPSTQSAGGPSLQVQTAPGQATVR